MILLTNMAKFFKKRLDLVIIVLIILIASPLFFYKLGQSSLVSWDEAWYAEIARNILKTGDPIHLQFNGRPYNDHPPFGFILISLSYLVFGVSEFSTRLPAAIMGILGLVFTYLLGKQLFNRGVGIFSAAALASAIWFVYRARSGNLDVTLTTLFLSTFYFGFKVVESKKFFIPLFISLIALFLTKTLVPFTVLPALIIILFKKELIFSKQFKIFVLMLFLFLIGWIILQISYQSNFIQRYLMIGYPGGGESKDYLANLMLLKEYLHNSIGKWFWPGVVSLILGIFTFKKKFIVLSLFFFIFITPFLFSSRGHIWHLVPLSPFLIISFFGFTYFLLDITLSSNHFQKIINKLVKIDLANKILKKLIIFLAIGTLGGYFIVLQIRQIWYQFIDIPKYVSDEAILSREAANYPYDLYIDEDFVPAAVFYSGKKVIRYSGESLEPLFKEKKVLLITHKWRIENSSLPNSEYVIIKEDRDRVLILRDK